jgi:opacity protein-like surface antigen
MTVRQILVAGMLVGMLAAPAHAQSVSEGRLEASVEGGYTWSEGVHASQTRIINGQIFDSLDILSGASWGFTVGYYVTHHAEVEFLYNRQSSTFQASGPSTSVELADMSIDNFHANFVYNFGAGPRGRVQPFAFGGLGATHYSPGDLKIPVVLPTVTTINSETRFSTTWGAGVKAYLAPKIGVRITGRWTPTYIKSDDAGLWCDPFYAVCWVVADAEYSNQFHLDFGATFRF